MGVGGDYLGMALRIDALDQENLTYFHHCAAHDFRLQRCAACGLSRHPPTTGCPWCGDPEATRTPVEGRGAVYTYAEVHHAIQPAFQDHLPYLILIVELDTQRGVPTEHDALRIAGNLATPDGDLAAPELIARVGIGTRVRMVFKDVAAGLAVPLWTIDETADQPAPWRYPEKIWLLGNFAMSTVRAKIDKAGRILIPAKLRTELNVGPGDPVVLETSGDELRVRPYRLAIREAQAIIRKYIPDRDRSLVDELIAERRKEAERE